jgi:hypothetical protein
MGRLMLAMAFAASVGCAGNRKEAARTRIRDTTLTPADTVRPNDTLPRIRDTVPDST